MRIKNIIIIFASLFFTVFAAISFFSAKQMYSIINIISFYIREWFSDLYLYIGFSCVIFLLLIAFSPLGKQKLGASNSKPEHSIWSWIAMLYSAGMGSGIILKAVREPVFIHLNPPINIPISSKILALEITFYQWGFTTWSFYALFAIIIGYNLFIKNERVLISLPPEKTTSKKWLLPLIDIIVIITTIFGLVASINLGATQINKGISHINTKSFDISYTIYFAITICVLASFSAQSGIQKGIKTISKINISLTIFILLFVIFNSDIEEILWLYLQATFHYIKDFVHLSLAIGDYNLGQTFLNKYTYYYWAFWIAWAPFTGVFIARISRGRTLREILIGTMVIPSLGSFIWFSAFGVSAFSMIEKWGTYQNEFGDVFTSIFIFFNEFPYKFVMDYIVIALIAGFLLTSVDSAIFVLSMFSSNGKKIIEKKHRILWGAIIMIICIAMLIIGNSQPNIDILSTLQKTLIISSMPFVLLIPIMSFLFLKELFKRKFKKRNLK